MLPICYPAYWVVFHIQQEGCHHLRTYAAATLTTGILQAERHHLSTIRDVCTALILDEFWAGAG